MQPPENTLIQRYKNTQNQIIEYADKYQRSMESIQLIAVSKRHPADKILTLLEQSQIDFAENYLQEGVEKVNEISSHCNKTTQLPLPCWHFIGHIQSRKSKLIAENFSWVHTLESFKVAEKLSQYRQDLPALNVLIQINLQQEDSKSGITIDQLEPLAAQIEELPNLRLRGLMIIPKPEENFVLQRKVFSECREQLERLNSKGHKLDQLSMGMTSDMQAAIAEGATQIRIGTAIFGKRPD